MNRKEFFIFLDVDGVLNATKLIALLHDIQPTQFKELSPNGYTGVEQKYIQVLKDIVVAYESKGYEVSIILSSDWKDGFEFHRTSEGMEVLYDECDEDAQYLIDNLAEQGLYITDKTPDVSVKRARGQEIIAWLNAHDMDESYENYLILDDNEFDFTEHIGLREHVLITETIKNAEPLVYIKGNEVLPAVATALDVIEDYDRMKGREDEYEKD